MPIQSGTNSIVFLDRDHVVRLIQAVLSWGEQDRTYARDFFLPETADMNALEVMGSRLRTRFGTVAFGPEEPRPADADVLVFRRGTIGEKTLDAMPRIKLIQRLGESPLTIDLAAARKRGIAVSCLPRATLAHVAEHVIFLALCLTRQSRQAFRAFGAGAALRGGMGEVSYNWVGIQGISTLYGKTLGIVGMGEIGVLVARRAKAFGMEVLFADSLKPDACFIAQLGARQTELIDLLAHSDIVSIHVPPKPGAKPLIGATELAAMRSGALLINTSRGAQVDEDALFDALSSRHLGGAGLDVHAHEPRGPDDRLAGCDNVVLTPHIGGGSRFGVLAELASIYENIAAILSGQAPIHGAIVAGGNS